MDQSLEALKREHIWCVFKRQQEVVRLDKQDEKEHGHGNRLGDEVTEVTAVPCVIRIGHRVDFGFSSKPTVANRTEKLLNQTSMLKIAHATVLRIHSGREAAKIQARGD